MKYRTIAIIFLLITAFSYYYTTLVKTIPIELEESDKTITQVDKVRFTFKVGLLAKKAYATYLLGLKKEDMNLVNESLDFYDSAIGFAYIKYTQDDKLLEYIVPRIEQSISIIDKGGINITTENLAKLTLLNSQISEFIQQNEQFTWSNIQNDYVEFRTDEAKSLFLFQVMFYMVLVFLIIMIIVLIQRARLHSDNEKLNKQLMEVNLHLEEKVKSRTKELAIKNDQLVEAQQIAKLGSWRLDLLNDQLEWSDETYTIFEQESTKFQPSNENFLDLIDPDDREKVKNAFERSLEEKTEYDIIYRLILTKEVKYIRERGTTHYNEMGKAVFTQGTVQDITKDVEVEQKIKEQEKIIQTQAKIAAVGEMLSNIAHQWRQPLSIISLNASNIAMEYELGEKVSKDTVLDTMESIQIQTDYLSKTIDDFRYFFKTDINLKEEVNLKDALDKIYDLIKDTLKNNHITCIRDIEDVNILLNENQLIQTIINICNNAKDALVNNCDNSDERVLFITVKKDENSAIVILKDSGGGIGEDIIDKVFEPYFTTKHQSVGTGIGLYMTHQIITKHFHGTIDVSNSEFEYNGKKLKGAEFVIKLPLKQ